MLKVLLVDDNRKALDGLQRHIRWADTGCVCTCAANNGEEALELAERLHPDIMITDVRMPGMDGLELCRRVRERFPNMHIIVISAHDEFEYARAAMRFGVENYILKPIDGEKLAELETLLQNISDTAKQYVESLCAFLGSGCGEALALSLRKGDWDETQKLLEDIAELRSCDIRVVEHVGIQLLRLLSKTMQDLGLTPVGETELSQRLNQLHTLHSREGMREYVAAACQGDCVIICQRKNTNTSSLVQRIKAFIEDNYTDANFSTYLIASKFSISQSYLCHIYKAIEGTSINTYATQLRMQEARKLLADTSLGIVEISARIGYLDAHYFAKVFHKLCGMTPSEYRRLRIQD